MHFYRKNPLQYGAFNVYSRRNQVMEPEITGRGTPGGPAIIRSKAMSEHFQLAATLRERAGKGNARATRKEGRIPAVIYGDNKPAVMVSLETLPLIKALHSGNFFTHLCEVNVDNQTHLVLARDVQMHPVKDFPEHIDFLRVGEKTFVTVGVPVTFTNSDKAPGVRKGGVLNVVLHEIEVRVRADKIPEQIEIDMGAKDIGDAVKISDIKLPNGAKSTLDADSTIATIAPPTVTKEDAEEDAAQAAAQAAADAAPKKK
jgi:large subunit ribosomal protein L25